MPKEKKATKGKRACALEKQLAYDATPKYKKKANGSDDDASDDEDGDAYVPQKLTSKTLALARQQQAEEAALYRKSHSAAPARQNVAMDSDSEDESDDDDGGFNDMVDDDDDELVRLNNGYVEDVEICEEDEKVLANFLIGGSERRNLADIIMGKIHEKEARDRGDEADAPMQGMPQQFDPKIVEVYTGVGKILQRYTSGKLPKAFKIIPSLSYWEDILWLTTPDKWSPHAMRAATRLFASNLNPKMAQRFFNVFLLEHCRQDIRDNKRLNFHLFMALKKALYKPQAFYKGIILPLCEGRDCTNREAVIIGSAISKVSVPVIHSAAALMKLAELPYSGANSVFIKILLNKKYSLPTRVIGALAQHFVAFCDDDRVMPVLWHQALLVFVERYKNDIPKDFRDGFKQLLKTHVHHQITPLVRRELFNE
ncbi:bystin [Achlya hypogyna]|uniref:Bystin n=1 Tax=Achlya hypogyna TaxID=1202772 RepID=A0A1V9YXZ5_ACHHY|nr:bystin [Achlya hypogyna]